MWEKVINVEFLLQGVEPEKLFAVPLEAKHNKVFVSVSQIFCVPVNALNLHHSPKIEIVSS